MSAMPPKADINRGRLECPLCPLGADILCDNLLCLLTGRHQKSLTDGFRALATEAGGYITNNESDNGALGGEPEG